MSEISFPVTVTIKSSEEYHVLARLAEAAGVNSITEYVSSIVHRAAQVESPDNPTLALHAEGLSNREIAVSTGETVLQVRKRINRNGLKSNTQRRLT